MPNFASLHKHLLAFQHLYVVDNNVGSNHGRRVDRVVGMEVWAEIDEAECGELDGSELFKAVYDVLVYQFASAQRAYWCNQLLRAVEILQ